MLFPNRESKITSKIRPTISSKRRLSRRSNRKCRLSLSVLIVCLSSFFLPAAPAVAQQASPAPAAANSEAAKADTDKAKAAGTRDGAMARQPQSFHHFLLLCAFARVPAGVFLFNLI